MFTDVVGYTVLSQLDEPKALRLLELHRQLLHPIIQRCSGQVIKTVGDGTLIEFPSALEAAISATSIQAAFRDYNLNHRGEEVRLRIGIHLGDVIHLNDDVLGDAVNIASRIEPLAEPGGICVTEQVFAQVRNKISTRMSKLPPQRLRHVEIPIELYKVIMPWEETNLLKEKSEVLVAPQGSFKRITSGIESLDIEIAGGFPEGTTTMICGAPHTGKSVFSYHFLMESIRMGEPCLFVMTDYGSEELMRAMSSFGWDIRGVLKSGLIRLLDMTSTESEEQMEDLQLVTSTSGVLQSVCVSVSIANLKGLMLKTVDILKPLYSRRERFRVVLDSLTPFFIYNPPMLVAKFLRQFAASMKNMGSVGIVLTYVEGSIDQQSELIMKSSVDNLIHLSEGEFIVEGMIGTPKTKMAYTITAQGLRMGI